MQAWAWLEEVLASLDGSLQGPRQKGPREGRLKQREGGGGRDGGGGNEGRRLKVGESSVRGRGFCQPRWGPVEEATLSQAQPMAKSSPAGVGVV